MNLLDLFVSVGFDDKEVDRGIASTSRKGAKFGDVLAKGFSGITKAVGVISTGFVALGTLGINYNAQMEQYQTSFEVMLGSEQEAIALTEQLKKKAAATPFEMTDLANVTQLLLNYGITSDKVVDSMGMLGDISQGSAEKLNRIASAYGQMSSLGKVQLEDIKQMIEAGFNPLNEISQRTGESMESLYERISKGTLSVDEITESMEYSTSEGGKYFQSMEKQSKTFNGLLSTLKDTATSALGNITGGLSEIATNTVLPQLIGYVEQLSSAFETGGFEGLFGTFGTVLGDIFAQISTAAPQIVNGALGLLQSFGEAIMQNIPTIVPAVLQIVTSIAMFLLQNIPLLIETVTQIMISLATSLSEQAPTLIPAIIDALLTIVETLMDNSTMMIDAAVQLMLGLANGLIAAIPTIIQRLPRIISSIVTALVNQAPTLALASVQLMIALIGGLIQAIPQLLAAVPQIIGSLVKAFSGAGGKLKEAGRNIVRGIWEGISSSFTWIKTQITTWVGNLITFFKKLLKIASPSGVMADEVGYDMGRGVGAGYGEGFASMIAQMTRNMDMKKVFKGAGLSMTGVLDATSAALGAGGIKVENNFYEPVKSPIATGNRIKKELEDVLYAR